MIHSNSEGDIYIEEMPLLLVHLREEEKGADARLSEVLSYALDGYAYETAMEISAFEDYVNRWRRLEKTQNRKNPVQGRILFAVPLGTSGINLELYRLIRFLREHPDFLNGFVGGLLVDSENDLYSKSAAKDLVFAANCAGCAFVGRPLVEGTRTLSNYTIVSNNLGTDLMGAYRESAAGLVKEVLGTDCVRKKCPKVLVLHASSHKTSNTYAIWNRVKEQLPEMEIREIGLRNGTLSDCAGCPYKMCLHFGEKGSCFYGGVMVEDVYPAVREADAIVMLCPNYNDALSANLTAFINRLTSLFRTTRFYDKAHLQDGLQRTSSILNGVGGNGLHFVQAVRVLTVRVGDFRRVLRFRLIGGRPDRGLACAGIDGHAGIVITLLLEIAVQLPPVSV